MATVIGISSFVPFATGEPQTDPMQCADVTGFPSYFARVHGGWDWIYETVMGNKLFDPVVKPPSPPSPPSLFF